MPKACIMSTGAHQTLWTDAFAQGLRQHGWTATRVSHLEPCDLLVLWGVKDRALVQAQKAQGGKVCILECGYVGDRLKWASVSFGGGLNGRGHFTADSSDGSRFERYHSNLLHPWQYNEDGPTILCGQVPGDQSLAGADIDGFYTQVAEVAKRLNRQLMFREHPVAIERGYTTKVDIPRVPNGTLQEVITGARQVVTYNSNSAVDAVLAGIPAVAADAGSMAWDVTSRSMCCEERLPRDDWANWLAWCQYNLAEMESGFCWEAVGHVRIR